MVCTSSGNEPLTLDASQKVHSHQEEVASMILDRDGHHRTDQAAPAISSPYKPKQRIRLIFAFNRSVRDGHTSMRSSIECENAWGQYTDSVLKNWL